MNKPKDENNFIIEVTPEQYDELKKVYRYSDEEPIMYLHYSPYWKRNREEES